jgi:tetratricopeptide (TPR) repeat protein
VNFRHRLAYAACALLAAGCANLRPPLAPAESARSRLPTREQTLERDYRARAAALMRDGRWADARVQWELLLVMDPAATEYRNQLDLTNRQIADTAADANAQAAAARKRGDLEGAATHFLRALAADRDNAVATQGLRDIERERVRRTYLNRPPRGMPRTGNGKSSGATVEFEPEYMQREKAGSGDEPTPAPRR